MKKAFLLSVVFTLVFATSLFSGCKGIFSKDITSKQVAEYNGHFAVGGSSAGMALFKPLTDAFSKNHRGVTFEYKPGSKTTAAINQVKSGVLDISVYARDLTAEEVDPKLRYDIVFYDPVAIVVNNSVLLTDLTTQQIRDIYSGKITDWSELGSTGAPITVCDRSEDETAKVALRKYVLGGDLKMSDSAVMLEKEADMVNAISSTHNSIGYYSMSLVASAEDSKFLKIDGAAPSVENVESGAYKVIRPIGIATLYQNETLKEFVRFLYSKEAKEIMVKNGFVPVKSEK